MLSSLVAVAIGATAVSAIPNVYRRQYDPTITNYETSPIEWVYPASRGYSGELATAYPCGGIEPGNRTEYPLSGGQVSLDAEVLVTNVNILYANGSNPQEFHEFYTYTNTILDITNGTYCAAGPDFAGGPLALSAGTNATLLILYQFYGNETYYYSCADISLVEATAYTAPSFTCANTSELLDIASPEDSLVLQGSNFSVAQEGDNGQTVSIAGYTMGTFTEEVHGEHQSETGSATGAAGAAAATAATTTSAAAASSSSAPSGAASALSVSGSVGGALTVVAMAALML